ncbi:MAG: restriction endonuclease subunit S [Eubacteriales bacterium]|nr:restriction endonuclease subunit S [Eubacteriales bacterium]
MKVRLGDVCTFQSGGTPSKSDPSYFGGTIPWITTVALNNSTVDQTCAAEWITDQAIKESSAKIVPANSILVGTRVGVGKVAVNSVPISTSQDIIALLNIDENKWDKAYLRDFIFSKKDFLQTQARGATIKGIKIDTLAELRLPDVLFDEQIKITKILRVVTNLITLNKKQISTLDEIIKSQFIEMFGDPSTNPKGYPLAKISSVASVKGGKRLPKGHTYVPGPTNHPYIRVTDFQDGSIRMDDLKYLSNETANTISRYTISSDDVYISIAGTIGLTGTVPQILSGSNLTENAAKIVIRDLSILNTGYLALYLQTEYAQEQVKDKTMSTTQPKLALFRIDEIEVILPPLDQQVKYFELIKSIDKSKFTIQKSLETLESLKNSLIQQYFG